MWYGERDENDPRRGLLGGTGLFSKEENELKRLNSELNNAIHAAQRCAELNDEKSRQSWLKKVDEHESAIIEIKSHMEELKNKVYISRPQEEVAASKAEEEPENGSEFNQRKKHTGTKKTGEDEKTLRSEEIKLYKYYRHKNAKDWGIGRVMGVTEQYIDILFTGTGMKSLRRAEAEQMLKRHPGKLNITELSKDPRFIESEKVLQQRHNSKVLQGGLQSFTTFELDQKYDYDDDLPVAGTGRRAPDYLRRFHRRNRHF